MLVTPFGTGYTPLQFYLFAIAPVLYCPIISPDTFTPTLIILMCIYNTTISANTLRTFSLLVEPTVADQG